MALDMIIGHRPDFVISDFCERLTQNILYIYIYMSISSSLCANDLYLHLYMLGFICSKCFTMTNANLKYH